MVKKIIQFFKKGKQRIIRAEKSVHPKHSTNRCSNKCLYMKFIGALLTVARKVQSSPGPAAAGEWINKRFYIPTTKYYLAIKSTDTCYNVDEPRIHYI